MFCSNCGNTNDDDSKFCYSCGSELKEENNVNSEKDKLNIQSNMPSFSPGHSIFLIIFSILCCGGVVGVIFAALSLVEGEKVNEYAKNGNIDMAKEAKTKADKWIKATYITWAVEAALIIIYFIFIFATSFIGSI